MGRLRLSGGQFKGFGLDVPADIRPTGGKVRQALFNILGEAVEGARVIDGFAGSGALGLEALSRGAAHVAFIESSTEGILAIRDNLARLEEHLPREAWRVLHLDIERGLRELAKTEPPFDLVLLDPPYRSDEGKKALNTVVECAMLAPAGLVAIEHDQRTVLPASIGPLHQRKRHRYGDTVLSFYLGA
jgi:16S rRNA (guanine(966)-N(2))-methyltransferase RsmD